MGKLKILLELIKTTTKYKVIAGAVAGAVVVTGVGGGYAIYKANQPQQVAKEIPNEEIFGKEGAEEFQRANEAHGKIDTEEDKKEEEEVKAEETTTEEKQETTTSSTTSNSTSTTTGSNVTAAKPSGNTSTSTSSGSTSSSAGNTSTGTTTTSNQYTGFTYSPMQQGIEGGRSGGNSARAGLYPSLAGKSTVSSFQSEANLIADYYSQGASLNLIKQNVAGKVFNGLTITDVTVKACKIDYDDLETLEYQQAINQGIEADLPSGKFTVACGGYNVLNGDYYIFRCVITFK